MSHDRHLALIALILAIAFTGCTADVPDVNITIVEGGGESVETAEGGDTSFETGDETGGETGKETGEEGGGTEEGGTEEGGTEEGGTEEGGTEEGGTEEGGTEEGGTEEGGTEEGGTEEGGTEEGGTEEGGTEEGGTEEGGEEETGCEPSCGENVCGDDGCGGSCGECDDGASCEDGVCVCTPNCGENSCGDDGCGSSCGACGPNEACNNTGQCECVPQCGQWICGDDGCGGTCGTCPAGTECDEGLSCISPGASCEGEGACGTISLSGNCYCDTVCALYGDCCADICTFCGDDENLDIHDFPAFADPVVIAGPAPNGTSTAVAAPGPDGSAALAWTSTETTGQTNDVLFGMLHSDGTWAVPPLTLATDAESWGVDIALSEDIYGVTYLITQGSYHFLYLVSLSTTGELLATSDLAFDFNQVIVPIGIVPAEGGFGVYWFETESMEVRYARVDFDGNFLIEPQFIGPKQFYGNVQGGDVTTFPEGDVLVLERQIKLGGDAQLMFAHVLEGNATGVNATINSENGGPISSPAIAWDQGSGLGVTYQASLDGEQAILFSTWNYDTGGTTPPVTMLSNGIFPDVGFEGSNYTVTYQAQGDDGWYTMTQLVDATGGLVGGGAAPALPLPDIGAMMPRIQWLGDRYVITTTNYVNAYTSPVIFGNQTCK